MYINLKGTEPHPLTPSTALHTLLTALLGPDLHRPQEPSILSHLWRAALHDKDALLILDDAADPAQVRPLLPGSPACVTLITSRRRFSLPGAYILDLDCLTPRKARELLRVLVPRLSSETADKTAQLCDGLPLALRLVGNYLTLNDDVSPEEYVALLTHERWRLAQLRDPSDPSLDMGAAISLSIAQLDDDTRRTWALLSIFPAPFDAPAAAALWGEGAGESWVPLDAETSLLRLRNLRSRSLVTYDPEIGRYDQHALLRLAAAQELDKWDERELAAARERVARHYLAVAEAVDEGQRYLNLDPDRPHLWAALDYASENNVHLLSDLVYALSHYWNARGLVRDWMVWCYRAAEACSNEGLRREEGDHLSNLGNAYAALGKAQQAIDYLRKALTIHREIGARRGEETDLANLGNAFYTLGDVQRAVEYYEQALTISREIGNRRAEGVHLGSLGLACYALGDSFQAIEHSQQALAISREIEDRRNEAIHLGNLGLAYAALGDARQAIEYHQQGLQIAQEIGDRSGEGSHLGNLGLACADLGDARQAIDYYERALEIAREIGDRSDEGNHLGNLGLAYAALGEVQLAVDYYEQARAIHREVGDRRGEAADLSNLGNAYATLGETQRAIEQYHSALEIARQIGDRRGEGNRLGNLGLAYADLGEIQRAAECYEQALAIHQNIGDRRGEGANLANLGILAVQQGDAARAHELWSEALDILAAIEDPNAEVVRAWLADLGG